MEIIDIFEIVDDALYSVRYNHEIQNEFYRLFENWTDASYLYEFFESHADDLSDPFWGGIKIAEAVKKTRKQALAFEEKLIEIAELGKEGLDTNLSGFFQPLVKGKFDMMLERDKAKGVHQKSWLRIYAIRIGLNLFLVSGGAIKLTKTMNERQHLKDELRKLELTRNYIMSSGEDIFSFCKV